MKNLDRKIKEIDQEIKDLPFKISQCNLFLKASIKLGIRGLIDIDSYLNRGVN